jgi:hypothetical protein
VVSQKVSRAGDRKRCEIPRVPVGRGLAPAASFLAGFVSGAGAAGRRDVPEPPIRRTVGNGLDRSAILHTPIRCSAGADNIRPRDAVSFPCAGAAGRPGWPGGICRLVRPSGGRFFPLVRKESEERHANGKGFAQRRPSLWIPILRNLRAVFALKITVRVPGLRPCRAFVICTGNRGGGKPPPYGGCSIKRTNPQGRILYPPVGTTRNFASARRERS